MIELEIFQVMMIFTTYFYRLSFFRNYRVKIRQLIKRLFNKLVTDEIG
jgi:hypothetical protein